MAGGRSTGRGVRGRRLTLGGWWLLAAGMVGACGGGEDGGTVSAAPEGEEVYRASCAECHGPGLEGTDQGPSFLSAIYAPDHHPDASFRNAMANGVRRHHWDFGDMPPRPEVSEGEAEAVIAYVRARQREAGIIRGPASPG